LRGCLLIFHHHHFEHHPRHPPGYLWPFPSFFSTLHSRLYNTLQTTHSFTNYQLHLRSFSTNPRSLYFTTLLFQSFNSALRSIVTSSELTEPALPPNSTPIDLPTSRIHAYVQSSSETLRSSRVESSVIRDSLFFEDSTRQTWQPGNSRTRQLDDDLI
jgi:hypothetical protein